MAARLSRPKLQSSSQDPVRTAICRAWMSEYSMTTRPQEPCKVHQSMYMPFTETQNVAVRWCGAGLRLRVVPTSCCEHKAAAYRTSRR